MFAGRLRIYNGWKKKAEGTRPRRGATVNNFRFEFRRIMFSYFLLETYKNLNDFRFNLN